MLMEKGFLGARLVFFYTYQYFFYQTSAYIYIYHIA